ncbi:MAG: sigma-70 family RNA polymerase sigma factor [Desulfatitalea sp.]|nr:sigma-70 family RNA polymerase sigma factor [Desulfatitalea sp.]NNK00903.1 sigma-70 family RNA polymerase sigma factor [Desulfatitalea sp.]
MGSDNCFETVDDYAVRIIKHKARQLVGRYGLTFFDREDLEQELMIDLLQRMRHFNPAKAKKTTFIARIVERHIATILEARHAQCRDWRLCRVSLNTPYENEKGDTWELIDRVDNEGVLRPCQHDTREIEINNLRMDVKRVLDTLPEDLRDLCERLRESNMAEIARETGVPRTTLYDKLTRIREAFRKAGLDDCF